MDKNFKTDNATTPDSNALDSVFKVLELTRFDEENFEFSITGTAESLKLTVPATVKLTPEISELTDKITVHNGKTVMQFNKNK